VLHLTTLSSVPKIWQQMIVNFVRGVICYNQQEMTDKIGLVEHVVKLDNQDRTKMTMIMIELIYGFTLKKNRKMLNLK